MTAAAPSPLALLLREVAIDVAHREDAELKALGAFGIFDMPELAFAYAVGKEMAHRARARSAPSEVKWERERGNGRQGITDLVFSASRQSIAVEFKMAAPRQKYLADIEKLAAAPYADHERALCLLVDAFAEAGVDDERIGWLEAECGPRIARVGELHPFPTGSRRYPEREEMVCVIGVWTVSLTPSVLPLHG